MGDFEADTLRDTLFTNWGLSDRLAKTDSKKRGDYVEFYANKPIAGQENPKYVRVRKEQPIEQVLEHPHFEEVRDEFEIEVYAISYGTDETDRIEPEQDIEDMCNEVVRIVKTVYNPLNETGAFFTTTRVWSNADDLDADQPYLKRIMRLTLTRLRAKRTKTFKGYSFIVAFDVSESEGTSLPGTDYTYATVFNVEIEGGYGNTKRLTKTHPDGKGIGVSFRTIYRGFFTMEVYADEDDLSGSGTHLLNNINTLLSNGEQPEIFLLTSATNTEGTPSTLTVSTKLRVTDFPMKFNKEELVAFRVQGEVLKPPTFTIT